MEETVCLPNTLWHSWVFSCQIRCYLMDGAHSAVVHGKCPSWLRIGNDRGIEAGYDGVGGMGKQLIIVGSSAFSLVRSRAHRLMTFV
jgi:hypothetical protein